MKTALLCLLLCLCSISLASTRLLIGLNANEAGNNWTYTGSWSLSGSYSKELEHTTLNATISSGFSRTQDVVQRDKLVLAARVIGKAGSTIRPLVCFQSESSHDFDTFVLIFSGGYRYMFNGGYVDLTAGVRKEQYENAHGDLGLEFSIEGKIANNTTVYIKPKASYDADGSIHFSDDTLHYRISSGVNCRISKEFGIGYQINIDSDAAIQRTQFIGITLQR